MVLKVTDFTHIAGFIYFIYIVYNCVVVVALIVVFVELIAVRNGCYNDYLPKVMLCLFFWKMDHEKESGRKYWMCKKSKVFSFGKLGFHICDPWVCKECTHVHSSSVILDCNFR